MNGHKLLHTTSAVAEPANPALWTKLRRSFRAAGREVVEKALCLYYAAGAPTTPVWAKTAIAGSLAYFILPLDAIPDIFAGVGYTDDLAVLAVAVATVAAHITPEHVERARKTLSALGRKLPAEKRAQPLLDTAGA